MTLVSMGRPDTRVRLGFPAYSYCGILVFLPVDDSYSHLLLLAFERAYVFSGVLQAVQSRRVIMKVTGQGQTTINRPWTLLLLRRSTVAGSIGGRRDSGRVGYLTLRRYLYNAASNALSFDDFVHSL